MKAIITKIIPATNTKPVRVKIQAEGVPHITVSRDALENELLNRGERVHEETIHQAAAKVLCGRYRWDGELASGGTPTCGTWCHCFIPQAAAGEKLETYAVEHTHRHGTSVYVVQHTEHPSNEQVVEACDIDYEPDDDESIVVSLSEITRITAPATPAPAPKPEPWKVLAVSDNHGSFGHKGVVVGRSTGEALELVLQAYGGTPLPNVGDLLDTLPTSEVQPRKLPQLPSHVLSHEFVPAAARDFLAICHAFGVAVSVARECVAIREAVDGGKASPADLERLFRREF